VRRALTWVAGAVGLAALLRHLSRRRATAPPSPAVEEDPADELRRKLAGQEAGGEPGPGEEPEPSEATDAADLEERRARVHEQAQAAIDSMHDATAGDPGGADA
jgi:hypothetical protein